MITKLKVLILLFITLKSTSSLCQSVSSGVVELRVPINNKKKIRCNIRGVREDDNIEIFCLDEINSGKNLISVSFQNIERAKLLAPYS